MDVASSPRGTEGMCRIDAASGLRGSKEYAEWMQSAVRGGPKKCVNWM